MKITVYGAEGEIGQKVISYALSQGAFVTACICDAGILWPRKNLTVVQGMMNNKEKVIEAMLEADIIISALTCGSTSRKSSGTPVADANATIISAMEQLYSRVWRPAGAAAAASPETCGNSVCGKDQRPAQDRTDRHAFTSELDTCACGESSGKRQWKRLRRFFGRQPVRYVGVAQQRSPFSVRCGAGAGDVQPENADRL